MSVWAVIMAGGSGTRFWPMSRRARPKQLLPLWGGRTLLEVTAQRLRRVAAADRLLVVTGRPLAEAVRVALPELEERNLLVEPSARNTLPCIALAVAAIRAREPDAVIGVFSADHHIKDEEAFARACEVAVEAARGGRIATLGITPTRPETGFGYIRCGAAPAGGADGARALPVEAFVEKPDLSTAERYLAEGRYLWNAGIFFFTAATFDSELARQRPELGRSHRRMAEAMARADAEGVRDAFEQLEATSLDYGLMEGARDVVVVPAEVGWQDVGHWGALDAVLGTDQAGNVVLGEASLHDATGCVVVSRGGEGKVVALVGMSETVVVDTPEATLVMPKAMAQRVREVVDALAKAGRSELI
jgi:mannose-1-phosphate guanylyltransferase